MIGSKYNDRIVGNSAANILVGGAGRDVLRGDEGRDLLIGGEDADLLRGNAGEDLLIADRTIHDENHAALDDILAEWTAGRSLAIRRQNLADGTSTADRLNGEVFLQSGLTVLGDTASDILLGGKGLNWLFLDG